MAIGAKDKTIYGKPDLPEPRHNIETSHPTHCGGSIYHGFVLGTLNVVGTAGQPSFAAVPDLAAITMVPDTMIIIFH